MVPMMMMAAGQMIKGFAQYASLIDQADDLNKSAGNDMLQKYEIRERAELNKKSFSSEVKTMLAQQQGMYAASGVEVATGASLGVMTRTMNTAVQRLSMMERETAFTLMMKDLEIESKFRAAGQAREAANMAILSAGFAAGGSIAKGG